MGKVFTQEEIEKKMIPSDNDFKEAIKFVKQKILESKTIKGGLIFGSIASVVDGNYNCRSDFDLLILCDSNITHIAINLELREFLNFFKKRNIPIDLVIIYDKHPKTDVHQIKPILISHLSYCAEKFGVIKKNPLDFIESKPEPAKDFNSYVRHKMRLESDFYKMDFMNEMELCRFLQKTLEAPFHVARNFLNCCGKGVKVHSKNRKEIIEMYSEFIDNDGLIALNQCRIINNRYTDYINECVIDNPKSEHFDIMRDLRLYAIESIKFIKFNAQLASNFW